MASAALPTPVRAGPRLAAAIVSVAVAYHFSLDSLAAAWRHETPLADLVLVPPLAALLLVAATRRYPHVASFRLGRLDLLVGGLLMLMALGFLAIGPVYWSKYFWAMRLDLLTLPLFAAAGVTLLFGLRALVPLWFPLAFLLLAWPLPYLAALEHVLEWFTRLTASAVGHVNGVAGIAVAVDGSDGSRYVVEHGGHSLVVSVASACSGVNSLVGFGVVGAAAVWFIRGGAVRRVLWLAFGACLVWALNVVRILSVLLVARRLGEHAAFDVLHPVAGILALNMAFLLAFAFLPAFGLRRRRFDDEEIVDTPLARSAPPAEQATRGRVAVRLVVLVAATATLALADGQLQASATGFEPTGRTMLSAFVERPLAPRGWRIRRVETIGWAAPYYGRHSTWVRFRLRSRSRAGQGRFTVWADAVLSPDLGALDAYTLAHCYAFHGFDVETARRVDLGSGVIGQLFVYRTAEATWHALAWEWPVLRRQKVEHERIVLLASALTRPHVRATTSSGGVAKKALALLDAGAKSRDENADLSRALERLGSQLISVRIASRPQA